MLRRSTRLTLGVKNQKKGFYVRWPKKGGGSTLRKSLGEGALGWGKGDLVTRFDRDVNNFIVPREDGQAAKKLAR